MIQAAPLLDLDEVQIDPACALRVPPNLATRRRVLPFVNLDGHVFVACADCHDAAALQAVERYMGRPVHPMPAEPASLDRALDRIFGGPAAQKAGVPMRAGKIDSKKVTEPDSDDAVGLCEELLYAAMIRQASDIHLDPDRDHVLVRFRVDGLLETYCQWPKAAHLGAISRFKVLAGMDIAEKRAPQDGRFSHPFGAGRSVDVRVASLPTRHGERMTLRLLATQASLSTLEGLGLSERDRGLFEQALAQPHGLILLTGPTGSGKSTTLHAAIRRLLERESLNVITIEDPVEYELHGVGQVEVDSADKVSFGRALRSVLRHDPDVVMIGEIRDRETADVAIKAALTGHLVLSTLHTNCAASAITRLVDMQVPPYLVGATLRLSVAQRLVRRLCRHCRSPRKLAAEEARALGQPALAGRTVYEPTGCLYCANRGYAGRVGMFELVSLDETLARRVAEGASEAAVREHLQAQKTPRLMDDAVEKLLGGATTFREVLGAVAVF